MTIPALDRLKHKWDPAFASGEFVQDTVGGQHALKGGVEVDYPSQFFSKRTEAFEDRARPPKNSTRIVSRGFREPDVAWVEDFTQSAEYWLEGLNGFSGWGYGGVLRIIPTALTFTEGMKSHSLTHDWEDLESEYIYLDLFVQHEYLNPHATGLNSLGRLKIDGADALIINLVSRDNVWNANGDQELMLNILQGDYTPYAMNLQPSNVNSQMSFKRWNWNRVQVLARRGSSGELHVWLNEQKIAEHTGLVSLTGAAWDGIELDFQWGTTLGPTLYDDVLDFPGPGFDHVKYGFLDLRALDEAPVWFNDPLNQHEPADYGTLIYDNGSNGKSLTLGVNNWDNGRMCTVIGGRVNNMGAGASPPSSGHTGWGYGAKCIASPLKQLYDPHTLLGAAHYEGMALEEVQTQIGETVGEWWDIRQWGWGQKFIGTTNYCRQGTRFRENLYACCYFSLGENYHIPTGASENKSLSPWIICVLNHLDFERPPHSSERGICIALTDEIGNPKLADGTIELIFETGATGDTSKRVLIERDRIYKAELRVTNAYAIDGRANWGWWIDGVEIDGLGSNEMSDFSDGISGIRWTHKYGWDDEEGNILEVPKEQNARLYYMYGSTGDYAVQADYQEPGIDAGPPAIFKVNQYADYGAGCSKLYPSAAHQHLKVPVGDDHFYVGGDRDEWTFSFVFRLEDYCTFGMANMALMDSWHELFGGFLPSIIIGGINHPVKGYGNSPTTASGEDPTKIQLNYLGTSYISVADTIEDTDWHTLVVSFSQYGTCHTRVWLDGVKTYDGYPDTREGRYFSTLFNSDQQKQYMTFFTRCSTGEWWRQRIEGSLEDDLYSDLCEEILWGSFRGFAGPIYFWDRQLMQTEVEELHEDLRAQGFATLPALTPATNTPDPTDNVTVVVDQGMCKATWDDIVDPGGLEVRFEVEISANSGGSWASLRDLSDGEPGGIPSLTFSARPRGTGSTYRIRVRGFNGVAYSTWAESADFEISEWAAFLIQSPTRDDGWFDGAAEYPGTRLAWGAFCYSPTNTIAQGDPSYPGDGTQINDFYYYEAPPGKAIAGIHFYDFKIERNLDWTNLWIYNPTDGWMNYADVRYLREEGFIYDEWLIQGFWGQHWVDIRYWVEQGWVSEETTAFAFDLEPYEHNSWFQDRGAVGFAVDSVLLTDGEIDNPEEPEEPVEPPPMGSPCAEYQECWLARPNLLDLETYFIPGDTHLFARTLFGLAAGVTVDSAIFRILEYEGGAAIVNTAATVVNIGDGSADLTYQLTQANTTSIGAEDARPYQLIVTLSDNNVYTVNAGIIKASAPASIPAP